MSMISIIVCTYNRSRCLKRMIESFFEQKGLKGVDYEMIIVDNNSEDDTRSIADGFMHLGSLHYVLEEGRGENIARNRGVDESQGEIVAFLGDNVIVDSNWLSCLQKCYEETGAEVVAGRINLIYENSKPIWLGRFFESCLSRVDLGNRRRKIASGEKVSALNLSMLRSVYRSAGGFNEGLGQRRNRFIAGEEADLLRRIGSLGKKVVYDPAVIVQHMIDPGLLEWNYFVAHAISSGHALAFIESRRDWPFQILRVGNALRLYVKAVSDLIRINFSNASPYEKSAFKWRVIRQKYFVFGRWKRLWNNLV